MSSPSVITQTIDKTTYIPSFTNEVAAFCGYFEKGPVDVPVFITDVNQFKFIFGRGVDLHHNDWYQVYNYLQYASGLWVNRTSGNRRWNACNEEKLYINTRGDFDEIYDSLSTNEIKFIAQTPGAWGNLLSVAIIQNGDFDANVQVSTNYRAKDIFSFFEENHYGICILRNDKIVEKYYLTAEDIETINNQSRYVYVKFSQISSSFYGENVLKLTQGSTNFPTDIDIQNSYDLFENKNSYDLDIIIGNDKYNNAAVHLAEKRRDSIAFIGVPTSFIEYLKLLMGPGNPQETAYTQSGLVLGTRETKIPYKITEEHIRKLNEYISSVPQSQFVHFTMNIKEQLDGFTGNYKLVNIAGDIAGLKSQASLETPWTVNAGLERGKIKNVNKIFFNLKDIDNYYKKGLNYVQNNILMSQKTYFTKPSSFSRVNTRSLFNHIEKEVEKLLRYYVFEENTYRVRGIIASTVKKYLEDVKANNGIDAGRVEVKGKDQEIIVDVYIKPKYVTEFIQLRMTSVGSETISNILSSTIA